MRILITVEYFGKNYAGWQCQDNALSVQEVLEEKLSVVTRQKIKLHASGRTDSGVHAYGQKAHFDYEGIIPPQRIAYAVNTMLPDDIRVVKAEEVGADFHAQYSAKRKTYVYKYYVSRTLSPIRKDTRAQIPYDKSYLDFNLMRRAVKSLVGTHDFKGFSSTGSKIENTVRTIYAADIKMHGDEIDFSVTGNGFLYNMVRIIAGTLAFIGLKKIPADSINTVFDTLDRTKAGKTYPACGLYLADVEYVDNTPADGSEKE